MRKSIQVILCLAAITWAGCAPSTSNEAKPILLFSGDGTSPNSVKALQALFQERQLRYAAVDSKELSALSARQLMAYRLLVVPGGNYVTMGNSLTPEATTNIHEAVQGGLNYLGICAGALLAGQANSRSLNLAAGTRFDFYAAVNRGVHKAAVTITGVGAPSIDHYWEDGPQFSGWGEIVGKYPDGTPAIAQGTSGKGWVILCGVHPEAPEKWRQGMTFGTPASAAHAQARTLLDAALHGTRLQHY